MKLNRAVAAYVTFSIVSALAVFAQTNPQRGAAQPQQPAQAEQGQQARRAPAPEEKSSVTRHSARIGGQQINYTATAATYLIKADDGTPKAMFFFAGYTKDDADPTRRPVSFVFNGGPGSASSYTHMGLGPKRIVLTDDGQGMPAPYSIAENSDSFLDTTDLVFVDAISTGYSRPMPGENPAQFYGLVQDATYFADSSTSTSLGMNVGRRPSS
jgi:carboxypeptidase C (cathepsin A)